MRKQWPDTPQPLAFFKLFAWGMRQAFGDIPSSMDCLVIEGAVSRTPMWLMDENPLANHPWDKRDAALLAEGGNRHVIFLRQ
jgi:hypothetical protein